MSFNFLNLDEKTKSFMMKELEADIYDGKVYFSKRFSEQGKLDCPEILRDAISKGALMIISNELRKLGRMKTMESKQTPKGGWTEAKVPITAPDTYAEGEFNRYYMRGLCLRAIEEGINEVIVYRAKDVSNPRMESVLMIDKRVNPKQLLTDLRINVGTDTAFGLPPGPNSGLSVRLP